MQVKTYPVPEALKESTLLTDEQYLEMYQRSITDPEGFWSEQSSLLEWYKQPTKVKNTSFDPSDISIKWFEDGELNASYNCIDKHLATDAKKTAILWEGDSPDNSEKVSYQQIGRAHV